MSKVVYSLPVDPNLSSVSD